MSSPAYYSGAYANPPNMHRARTRWTLMGPGRTTVVGGLPAWQFHPPKDGFFSMPRKTGQNVVNFLCPSGISPKDQGPRREI